MRNQITSKNLQTNIRDANHDGVIAQHYQSSMSIRRVLFLEIPSSDFDIVIWLNLTINRNMLKKIFKK
jgi:hypothetical protein